MGEFENGMMRLANPQTRRAGGAIHLIHPDHTKGVRPLCRPGYSNSTNVAQPVPDGKPVTCLLCVNISEAAGVTPKHRAEDA